MGKYLIVLLIILLSPLMAQLPKTTDSLPSYWSIYHSCTSAPCVWTVQKTASGTKKLRLMEMTVYCATAGTLTQERDGSVASGNAITPKLLNTEASYTAGFTAHSASGSSGGSSLGVLNIPAAEEYPIDLTKVYLFGNTTSINYTARMSAGCGNAKLFMIVQQYD